MSRDITLPQREIKFRAWSKEGLFTDDGCPGMIEDITSLCLFYKIWHDDNFIKMQYTGLKDKNGEEIYEGDLFRWANNNCFIEYVAPVLQLTSSDNSWWGNLNCILIGREIIGNIYENPELLEG